MISQEDLHYIPGEKPIIQKPLDRYLPPLHEGVIKAWLDNNLPKGCLILDPFGSSPDLCMEAARCGYRVIVTANNPIIRFILEMRCNPPTRSDFQSAIATLSSSQVGSDRLEPYIKTMYETTCETCGSTIQAESFLWKRGEKSPYAKIYQCTSCGDMGEYPVRPSDVDRALKYSLRGPHHARALERVAPLHDPDRPNVEEALEVYLPRALHALVTIINKLISLPDDDPNLNLLNAVSLLAFDRANTLWLYPKARERPKQLTVPKIFEEHNIWLAIETAVDLWLADCSEFPLTKWPELPQKEGGICLFEGRVKDLSANLVNYDIDAVLTSFPRPNQAFWTLCALWAGWLWGHETLSHFKGVLRRRRYDWSWHTTAIQYTLNSLVPDLRKEIPFFGIVNEVEPGFLSSVILGCQLAGLEIINASMRNEDTQAQILWQSTDIKTKSESTEDNINEKLKESIKSYLQSDRGEPAQYLYLHLAGLIGIAQSNPPDMNLSPSEYQSNIHNSFRETLTYKNGFLHYVGSGKQIETGTWWMQKPKNNIEPLADRVEIEVVKILLDQPVISFSEMDIRLCQVFSGLTPPEISLIQMCLLSYGHCDPPESKYWTINEGDLPKKRIKELDEISFLLSHLGKEMGYLTTIDQKYHLKVEWIDEFGQETYRFYISASAILGKYLVPKDDISGRSILVIPGSRSNLIIHKLNKNQYLNQIIEQQWQFIKFRHVRRLAESINLIKENLDEQLSLDPLTYTKPQMRFI